MLLTNFAFYNFLPEDSTSFMRCFTALSAQRVIAYGAMSAILISSSSSEMVIECGNQYDYELHPSSGPLRQRIIDCILTGFNSLRTRPGKKERPPLPVVELEDASLGKYVCDASPQALMLRRSLDQRYALLRKSILEKIYKYIDKPCPKVDYTRPSKYCFDYCSLAQDEMLQDFIKQKEMTETPCILFSDDLCKINDWGIRQRRVFCVTPMALYNFMDSSSFNRPQRIIYLQTIEGMVRSVKSNAVVVQVEGEQDYQIEFLVGSHVEQFCALMCEQYERQPHRLELKIQWAQRLDDESPDYDTVDQKMTRKLPGRDGKAVEDKEYDAWYARQHDRLSEFVCEDTFKDKKLVGRKKSEVILALNLRIANEKALFEKGGTNLEVRREAIAERRKAVADTTVREATFKAMAEAGTFESMVSTLKRAGTYSPAVHAVRFESGDEAAAETAAAAGVQRQPTMSGDRSASLLVSRTKSVTAVGLEPVELKKMPTVPRMPPAPPPYVPRAKSVVASADAGASASAGASGMASTQTLRNRAAQLASLAASVNGGSIVSPRAAKLGVSMWAASTDAGGAGPASPLARATARELPRDQTVPAAAPPRRAAEHSPLKASADGSVSHALEQIGGGGGGNGGNGDSGLDEGAVLLTARSPPPTDSWPQVTGLVGEVPYQRPDGMMVRVGSIGRGIGSADANDGSKSARRRRESMRPLVPSALLDSGTAAPPPMRNVWPTMASADGSLPLKVLNAKRPSASGGV